MKRLFFVNKIFLATVTAIAFGFAGTSDAQSSGNDKTNRKDVGAGKKLDGGYSMKHNPVQGGTEKSLGSSKPGSAGSGGSGSRD